MEAQQVSKEERLRVFESRQAKEDSVKEVDEEERQEDVEFEAASLEDSVVDAAADGVEGADRPIRAVVAVVLRC